MRVQYHLDGTVLHHRHHYTGDTVLQGADRHSFRTLVDPRLASGEQPEESSSDAAWFAADAKTVWFMNQPVPDADPATFQGFWGGQCKWGRDFSRVWCFYVAATPICKPMRTADAASFGFFSEPLTAYMREYARDRKSVFYYGRRVVGAHPKGFAPIEEDLFLPDEMRLGGASSPPNRSSDYRRCEGVDAIWYRGRRLSGVDAASFLAIEDGFGLDRSGFWDGLEPIGRQSGREHFDLYVASRPELDAVYWRGLRNGS